MIHKTIAITMGLALVLGALSYGATQWAFANPCSTNGGSGTGGTQTTVAGVGSSTGTGGTAVGSCTGGSSGTGGHTVSGGGGGGGGGGGDITAAGSSAAQSFTASFNGNINTHGGNGNAGNGGNTGNANGGNGGNVRTCSPTSGAVACS